MALQGLGQILVMVILFVLVFWQFGERIGVDSQRAVATIARAVSSDPGAVVSKTLRMAA
jgi:hypothetical protein